MQESPFPHLPRRAFVHGLCAWLPIGSASFAADSVTRLIFKHLKMILIAQPASKISSRPIGLLVAESCKVWILKLEQHLAIVSPCQAFGIKDGRK